MIVIYEIQQEIAREKNSGHGSSGGFTAVPS